MAGLVAVSGCETERPLTSVESAFAAANPSADEAPGPDSMPLPMGAYQQVVDPTSARGADSVMSSRLEPTVGQALKELHAAHYVETRLLEFALTQGLSVAGVELATRLVRDHRAADLELLLLADDLGIPLAVHPSLSRDQQRRVSLVARAVGPEFERRFAQQLVELHEHQLEKARAARQRIRNGRVAAHVDAAIEMMRRHVEQARSFQRLGS
jgi:predicted outer membrane protein